MTSDEAEILQCARDWQAVAAKRRAAGDRMERAEAAYLAAKQELLAAEAELAPATDESNAPRWKLLNAAGQATTRYSEPPRGRESI